MERATVSVDRGFDRLRRSIDATYRDSQKFEAGQKTLGRALDSGRIDLVEYNRQLDLLAAKYRNADAAQAGLRRGAGALGGAMGGLKGFAGGLGVGTILSFLDPIEWGRRVGAAVSSLDDLGDAAERAGISGERLQILRHALELNAGSADQADAALIRFNKSIGEVALSGSGPAAGALTALGISIRDTAGQIRPTGELFDEVTDKLGRVGDQARIQAIAARLFGREAGSAMAVTLAQGTAAMEDYEAHLRSIGGIASGAVLDKADELDKRFRSLSTTISVAFKTAAVNVADSVFDIIGEMNRLADSIPKPIDASARGAATGSYIGNKPKFMVDRAFEAIGSNGPDPDLHAALYRKAYPITVGQLGEDDTPDLERRAKAIANVTKSLQFEMDQLGRTSREQEVYNQLSRAGVDINSKAGQEIASLTRRLHDQREAQRQLEEVRQESIRRMQDIREIGRETGRDLVNAFRDGKITTDEWADALGRLSDRLFEMSKNSLLDKLFGKQGSDSFGMLGGALLNAIPGIQSAAPGGVTFGVTPGLHHEGGIAGYATSHRTVPAATFFGAERYHGGGIAGLRSNEVPAILQRGERILPVGQPAGGLISISMPTTIDARGSQITEAQFAAMLDQRDQRIRRELPAMVQSARGRGQF